MKLNSSTSPSGGGRPRRSAMCSAASHCAPGTGRAGRRGHRPLSLTGPAPACAANPWLRADRRPDPEKPARGPVARRIASVQGLAGSGINLSVEMETGTGKTYTYVKTIYELNARYGWSRFIIVVPSVAVREASPFPADDPGALRRGVRQAAAVFHLQLRPPRPGGPLRLRQRHSGHDYQHAGVQLGQEPADHRPAAGQLRGRRPIDVIAATRPILIIDEPQSVEGRQTRESLRKFNALFTLRYSATHREAYNMVYRLDALDAYNRHLVGNGSPPLGVTFTSSPAAGGFVLWRAWT